MIKQLLFTPDYSCLDGPHAAGGCLLPGSMDWPRDGSGGSLLHLLTIPAGWVIENSKGWISVFTPYYLSDTYLHWEGLTASDDNKSAVVFHNNDGVGRNEYCKELSPARKIVLNHLNEEDSDRNLMSKIYGIPAWLQDREVMEGYKCLFAINGNDIDIGFSEEPGIFSDGVIYVFLRDNFNLNENPSVQGVITFQFT